MRYPRIPPITFGSENLITGGTEGPYTFRWPMFVFSSRDVKRSSPNDADSVKGTGEALIELTTTHEPSMSSHMRSTRGRS